jgi:flagellar biosynthesis/type III secretory pathway protein FliH
MEDTLWLRLLGKGRTQEDAIAELLLLPETNPKRATALDLLVRWRINIEMTATVTEEEEGFLMALSQAYLEWERQTKQQGRVQGVEEGEQRGKAALILMQLRSRLGELLPTIETQIAGLPVEQLDQLAIALLSFDTVEALEQWLPE